MLQLRINLLLLLCVSFTNAWVVLPSRSIAHLAKTGVDPTNRQQASRLSLSLEGKESNDDSKDDGWGDDESTGGNSQEKRLTPIVPPKVQKEPERDTFIPIVAVVSLLGLFASYGYEMARLASRGELYLPWN